MSAYFVGQLIGGVMAVIFWGVIASPFIGKHLPPRQRAGRVTIVVFLVLGFVGGVLSSNGQFGMFVFRFAALIPGALIFFLAAWWWHRRSYVEPDASIFR